MGIRVPRITLKADYGDEKAFGDLSLLSIGYGLRQAWIYAAMFGTSTVFGIPAFASNIPGHSLSLTYFTSIIVFSFCLLLMAARDQKILKHLTPRKTLIGAALTVSFGTALLLLPVGAENLLIALEIASGILTGFGTSLLILFWGTAFARCGGASIVINTAVAIVVGVAVYAVILQQVPHPLGGVFTALLPLGELFILLRKAPSPTKDKSYAEFHPLPTRHGKFLATFGLPVFIFGIALGTLRQTSIQTIMPAATTSDQLIMLLASGSATILILVTVLALGGSGQWNRYFRPLIPFIAIAVFFLPFSQSGNFTFSSFVLLIAYMCFEALMWIFFGELSHQFRLSPVFVYGIGRGLLASAALIGSFLPIISTQWVDVLPFGEDGITILILLVMVIAYALLPHEKEMAAIIAPCPLLSALPHLSLTPDVKQPSETTPSFSKGNNEPKKSGHFKGKCEVLAATYLLSHRESEVLFFLAKGHNSAYIQEKLYISEGTAKTHIRHIYKKLGVHSQQELMRMTESAAKEAT